ncbi:MAG: adenosylcobinamide amidohydrolase [Candidatus Bathyarchaeales archaeon]
MKTYELLGKDLRLLLKDDTLALISKTEMTTVSSAIYNGGFKKAKAVLNVHVPKDYDDKILHENPEQIVLEVLKKFNLDPQQTVGMITAADVGKFSMMTTEKEDLIVSAIATAGCSLAETAGENIETDLNHPGTINTIVAIHGNPTESCLMQTFITATEAKTASLKELDVRSKYSGDPATGTVTDSLVIVSTNNGPQIKFGGPTSKLGKLVGYCVRKAVKNAIIKQGLSLNRSIFNRFAERNLPIKEFISEISKASSLRINEEEIMAKFAKTIEKEPFFALMLMVAANMDEDAKKGLIPKELGNLTNLNKQFKEMLLKLTCKENFHRRTISEEKLDFSKSPFLKQTLISIIEGLF